MVGQQILALPVGVRVPAPQYNRQVGQETSCPTFLASIMASPIPPSGTNRYWIVVLVLLSVAVGIVMAILAGMVLTLPAPPESVEAAPTGHGAELSLPTAPLPTITSGPPLPLEAIFVAQTPIKGYSNCEVYGFYGAVRAADGNYLKGIQVVVWEEKTGLLSLDTTDTGGNYRIQLTGESASHKFWVQIFQDDYPVSEPLPVEFHRDCQNGFQIYQVDWQEAPIASRK